MRILKQHMLLLYTSSIKVEFYFIVFWWGAVFFFFFLNFSPFKSHCSLPLMNSHLPSFGKSLRVFEEDRLK